MIFVTLGTHNQGFMRLIKTIDDLVGSGKIKEKVLIQKGYTDYKPINCESFDFTTYVNFIELCKTSLNSLKEILL